MLFANHLFRCPSSQRSFASVLPSVRLPLCLCVCVCVFVRSYIPASIRLCVYSSIYSLRLSMLRRSIRLSVCFYNMDALYTTGTSYRGRRAACAAHERYGASADTLPPRHSRKLSDLAPLTSSVQDLHLKDKMETGADRWRSACTCLRQLASE